jgi:hypothetical protein
VQSHRALWSKVKKAAAKQRRHHAYTAISDSPAGSCKGPASIRRRVMEWIFELRWACLCDFVCLDISDISDNGNTSNISDTISKLDLVFPDNGDSKHPPMSQHLPLNSLGHAHINFQKWLEGIPKPFDAGKYKIEVSRFSWTTSATSLEA